MNFEEYKKKLFKTPDFNGAFDALEPESALAAALIRLRLAKGLTQEQLAMLLGTKQESIARMERGKSLPSLNTVRKVANALDAELEITLRPRRNPPPGSRSNNPLS